MIIILFDLNDDDHRYFQFKLSSFGCPQVSHEINNFLFTLLLLTFEFEENTKIDPLPTNKIYFHSTSRQQARFCFFLFWWVGSMFHRVFSIFFLLISKFRSTKKRNIFSNIKCTLLIDKSINQNQNQIHTATFFSHYHNFSNSSLLIDWLIFVSEKYPSVND